MSKHLIPFRKHPEFLKLQSKIAQKTLRAKSKLVLPVIEVGGIPFSLVSSLVSEIESETKTSVFYTLRDSQEIRKFLETLIILELSSTTYNELLNILSNNNFQRVGKIDGKKQFSVHGDIVNFWTCGYEHPLRVSFFGEKFEAAVFVDEVYGRPYQHAKKVVIGDNSKLETVSAAESMFISSGSSPLSAVLIFGGDSLDTFDSREDAQFDFSYPTLYFQRFDLLERDLQTFCKQGYTCMLVSSHSQMLPKSCQQYVVKSPSSLEAGFVSRELQLVVLTDRELFGTVFVSRASKKLSSKQARKLLAELEGEIEIGDYIVHEDYGIGIYKGIKQEEFKQDIPLGFNEFKTKVIYEDYLLIGYAAGDELYVPLNQLDKITKYIGSEDEQPVLTRLGKAEWQKVKRKVKASVAIFARELVEHYAKRATAKAVPIKNEPDALFSKFIDNFPYKETEDQLRTEQEVYTDLRSSKPMNRLIVGDVGFGKTEIAMRAAFKVTAAGMQVAVLCPTTVLAAQHYKVFTDRFKGFKVRIAALSRFSKHKNLEVINKIKAGKIDIVVGTHRLLSNDLQFKKLGLIVIDEEQKFGVKQKEKLKKLEYGVHVLSMSATPIPRTLSMALSTIQDISIIQTPPEGRQQVQTFVEEYSAEKMVKAVLNEVKRNGQVYYLHNRVSTITSTKIKLERLLPGIRIAYAHGQMDASLLEKTMSAFYNHEYDLLLCTTIIENGIDMPNVNTIIIEHAQNYGLGQLYQLRGRVGRSEKQAYAYLFYEGDALETNMREVAELDEEQLKKKLARQKYRRRLKAIMESQELGSGFRLASRDLEIRGAGNLLGREQHGNISHIGYGLYMQLLTSEIEKLKHLANYENIES